jgi:hypothetical protein
VGEPILMRQHRRPELVQKRAPGLRQLQRIGTAIARRRPASDQSTLLQPVDDGNDRGAVDAHGGAEIALIQSRILGNQGEHAELPRGHIPFRDRRREILEQRHLRPAEIVADQRRQHAEVRLAAALPSLA